MTGFDKNNFNIACNETIEIIMHMEDKLREKIPPKMMEFLSKNQVEGYNVSIDFSKNILEQDILFETKSIIAIIYRDYIVTPQKRKELIEWDRQEELRSEKERREKYNPDNIFTNKNSNTNIKISNELKENMQIVEYKEQKWYQKLFVRILKLLKFSKK